MAGDDSEKRPESGKEPSSAARPAGSDQVGPDTPTQPVRPSKAFPEIPNYEILGVLGEGGMGTVYEARQESLKRVVALKVMKRGAARSELEIKMFGRETQALARLQHPGIVPVFDSGVAPQGQYYFAMELVDGISLDEYVKAKDVPFKDRLRLMAQICDAVAHAHQHGVIHRDLKPSNILVDSEGRPRILDFGLAKLAGDEGVEKATIVSLAGELLGTIQYMSPEQTLAAPAEIDRRTDVYSLGVILYEILTGQMPYSVTGIVHQVLEKIRDDPPKRPSTALRRLKGDIETILLKALEKERKRRYQSAGEFRDDIERYLRNEPILARPPSAIYQIRKMVQRNWAVVRIACAALLLIVAVALALHFVPIWSALARLDDQDARVRGEAWDSLRTYAPSVALAEALHTVRSGQNEKHSIEALGVIAGVEWGRRSTEALEVLAESLHSNLHSVRMAAAELLADRGPTAIIVKEIREPSEVEVWQVLIRSLADRPGPMATDQLKRLLAGSDPRLAGEAEATLASLTESGLLSGEELARWISDPDQRVRVAALRLACEVSGAPELQEALVTVLAAEGDGVIRRAAAAALAAQGARVKWETLTRLVEEEYDPGILAELAKLVGIVGDDKAASLLRSELARVLTDPGWMWSKAYAVELTVQIGQNGEPAAESMLALLPALETEDERLQREALRAMWGLDLDSVTPGDWASRLASGLSARNPEVREGTWDLIVRVGWPQLVPAMVRTLEETQEPYTRSETSQALAELHLKLVKSYPGAARAARVSLIRDFVRGTRHFQNVHLPVVVMHEWASTDDLVKQIPEMKDPQWLDGLGELVAGDYPDSLQAAAADWLRRLTGGSIDPGSDPDWRDSLSEGEWEWDDRRSFFVRTPR